MTEKVENMMVLAKVAISQTQEVYEKICEKIIENYNALDQDAVRGPADAESVVQTIIRAKKENIPHATLDFDDGESYIINLIVLTKILEADGFVVWHDFEEPNVVNHRLIVSMAAGKVPSFKREFGYSL